MRKKLQIIAIAGMILCTLSMTGCQTKSAAPTPTSAVTEEEIQSATEQLGEDITSGKFWLNGTVMEAPITVQDLQNMGFEIDENVQEQVKTLGAGKEIITNIRMSRATEEETKTEDIDIRIANPTNEKIEVKDAQVVDLDVYDDETPRFVLPKGITWDSTMEEVEAAYEETEKTESEQTVDYTYIVENKKTRETYTIRFMKGKGDEFEMSRYGYWIKNK